MRDSVAYDGAPVVSGLNMAIPSGRITALVGGNGCGKSTLLRSLARLMKPRGGEILLDGASIATMSTMDVARRLGILPQGPVAPEGLTVRDLVAIKNGAIWAQGAPEKVMTREMVRAVVGMECRIVPDPVTGTPMCVPLSRVAVAAD